MIVRRRKCSRNVAFTTSPRVFFETSASLMPGCNSPRIVRLSILAGDASNASPCGHQFAALVVLHQRRHVRRSGNFGALRLVRRVEQAHRAVRILQIRPRHPIHLGTVASRIRSRVMNASRQSPAAMNSLRNIPRRCWNSRQQINLRQPVLPCCAPPRRSSEALLPSRPWFEKRLANVFQIGILVPRPLSGSACPVLCCRFLPSATLPAFFVVHQRLVQPARRRIRKNVADNRHPARPSGCASAGTWTPTIISFGSPTRRSVTVRSPSCAGSAV